MSVIVPTITAYNPHTYRQQIERVEGFTQMIHVDLMDGEYTDRAGIDFGSVWWPDSMRVSVHLMYNQPDVAMDVLVKLKPSLIIVPVTTQTNETKMSQLKDHLHSKSIELGISLLENEAVQEYVAQIELADHLLIFSGNLGYQGGSKANLGLLTKANEARRINPGLSLGWDGGVNIDNVEAIAEAGIDLINVGGFIAFSENPELAYDSLADKVNKDILG